MRRRCSRTAAQGLSALGVAALLAACMPAGADNEPTQPQPPVESVAAISIAPEGTRSWRADRPVVVAAALGTLTDVVVRDGKGKRVKGSLSSDASTWTSSQPMLGFDTRYVVRARAVDANGLATRETARFRTAPAKAEVTTVVTPYDRQVVGVGMPIIVTFSAAVPDRATVERLLSVRTTPLTQGSWHWVNDQQVRWRPREYWQAGTQVVVRSELDGVYLGRKVWGADDDRVRFTVGDAMIATVDIKRFTMKVERNGTVIRRMPVTNGKPGWDTRNGVKVIMSKSREVVMDAATIDVSPDDPEYYRLDVEYAMRLTWSGEYVHAAPWSVSQQGRANVSHGCTGMSMRNAAWYYGVTQVGDIVQYVNGSRPMEPWNGHTDWTMSWRDWKAGSALS